MSIRVEIDGNSVNIDGGKVFIQRDNNGKYEVKALDFHTVTTSNRRPQQNPVTGPDLVYDPHYYSKPGSNNLTVQASVGRAYSQVLDILQKYGFSLDMSSGTEVVKVIRRMIVANKGRDKVYSLVGRIAKDMDNEVYKGVPFHILFDLLESGKMEFPALNREPVNSRYGSTVKSYPPYTGYHPFSGR